jgi:hypothetical protein
VEWAHANPADFHCLCAARRGITLRARLFERRAGRLRLVYRPAHRRQHRCRILPGWFTGPRIDASIAAEFFLIEEFYTNRPVRYTSVEIAALHSHWPLDEERRHALAQMQAAFAAEWLFYREDARAATELASYAKAELATGEVNLRFERIARLSTLQPNWTYYSPHFERGVLRHVAKRWPLEYRFDLDLSPAL